MVKKETRTGWCNAAYEAAALAYEGLSKTFWWDCWVWVTPKTPRWDVDEPRGRKIIKEESNSPVPVGVKQKSNAFLVVPRCAVAE